jgi:hypothetical protein
MAWHERTKLHSRDNAPAIALDRRKQERLEKAGSVLLFGVLPNSRAVHGRLVDVSDRGFRASHDFALFKSGAIVRFQHADAEGQAQVVWNRSVEGKWESGFVVV